MAVEVTGARNERYDEILTERALGLIERLHREYDGRRRELLERRRERVAEIAAGASLGFLPETKDVRDDPDWRVAAAAPGLVDRRVEITGPTDRKMTINALNSGAKVWLADQEDANTPTWENVVGGQLNLLDAITRRIDFSTDAKSYALKPDDELATIVVRPRGWHLPEKHIHGRRRTGERFAGGLRAVLRRLRAAAARPRPGAVLLPAEDGVAPGGAALERRVRDGAGVRSASRAARSGRRC